MKISTWNVNSLKVRLPQLLDWLRSNPVDVLALQEIKCLDEGFPLAALQELGYHSACSGQKTYNGVALLSRTPLADVKAGMPGYRDEQKRVLAATVNGVRVISVYVPNGQSVGSEKYQYKLLWLEALRAHLQAELAQYPQLVVLGDYNIAPTPADTHDPAVWEGNILCSEPERAAFRALQELGFTDCWTLFEHPPQTFTWWDYRQAAFRRNMGLRIDHVLASAALTPACKGCDVDKTPRKNERPSDHAPVFAEFAL